MSTIKVLDKGYVTLVDHWGDDNRPANTARTSYNDAGKTFSEARNKGLSDYLIRHNHNTPVEFNAILFYMKMPIFVARQWVRHRTQSLNEISYRYVQAQREFYIPDRSRMALQSTDNKQGSSDILIENPEVALQLIENGCNESFNNYEHLIALGVNNEVARTVLPLGTYTEWYTKMDLHNLFHLLDLRLDAHAQYEIRVYAEACLQLIEPIYPNLVNSWKNHTLEALKFSQDELQIMNIAVDTQKLETLPKSRQAEFLSKMQKFNFLAKCRNLTEITNE